MGVIGLEPQRFVVVVDRAIIFAGNVEGVAAELIAIGIVRREPDGLVERFDRSNRIAAPAKNLTAGAKSAGKAGIPGNDRIDLGQRLVGLADAI